LTHQIDRQSDGAGGLLVRRDGFGRFVMFMMPESAPRKLATENTAVRSA
jgi:hypothetical protein